MDDSSETLLSMEWADPGSLPQAVMAGESVTFTVLVTQGGAPLADVAVLGEIILGGGMLQTASVVTDADGMASFVWTAGPIPVNSAVRLSIDSVAVFLDFIVQVTIPEPMAPASFAGVEELLSTGGVTGSTEGLAFDASGNLWLAAPGNLVRVTMNEGDASSTLVPVGGDSLEAPLGMAWDYLRECLWIADKASVRRVTFESDGDGGLVATAHTVAGLDGLDTPNSIAIRDNKYVYFSDSCTGNVYRFEPGADTVAATVVASFGLDERGGPNGLAFDDSGRLWITTENVGLLCTSSGADVTKTIGGLYYVDVSGDTFAEPVPWLENFAMFGDGLAFDADGNLYVIFDHFNGFTLVSSAVWLVPVTDGCGPVSGESGILPDACYPVMVASVAVPYGATAPDRLIANMAWGGDEFGSTTVYFSLLAVTLVAAERGAMSAEFGIEGRSLLPADLPQ